MIIYKGMLKICPKCNVARDEFEFRRANGLCFDCMIDKERSRQRMIWGKARAADYGAYDDGSRREIADVVDMQGGLCNLCQQPFGKDRTATDDHTIPLARGGGHTAANQQALCKPCNSSKGNRLAIIRDY